MLDSLMQMFGQSPEPQDTDLDSQPSARALLPAEVPVPHLQLPDPELEAIKARIRMDAETALEAHSQRIKKFGALWEQYHALNPDTKSSQGPNYQVPLVRTIVTAKLAMLRESLFGEDAQIYAEPIGKQDEDGAKRISQFGTWRLFKYCRIVKPMVDFLNRVLIQGRAISYFGWRHEVDEATGRVTFDGPHFEDTRPDDIIVPAERHVRHVSEFTFIIRRKYYSLDTLLEMEENGQVFGIRERLQEFLAQQNDTGTNTGQTAMKQVRENVSDVNYSQADRYKEPYAIEVYQWYGRWRLPNEQAIANNQSPALFDYEMRDARETDVLVHYVPHTHTIIGVQRLTDMYPGVPAKYRRPFIDLSFGLGDEYWVEGLAQKLTNASEYLTALVSLQLESAKWSSSGTLLWEAAAGLNPELLITGPGGTTKVGNVDRIKQITFQTNPAAIQMAIQELLSFVERDTGVSDQTLGRAIDRPNAPRTATGQEMLLRQGNILHQLDTSLQQEQFVEILRHWWALERCFLERDDEGKPTLVFRVTEEEGTAMGLEQSSQWKGLDESDLNGSYDFSIGLSTTELSKMAQREIWMQLYGMDMNNELIRRNPTALYRLTAKLHEQLGVDFSSLVPPPPDIDVPKDPWAEFSQMQAGKTVMVHPADNDQAHLTEHYAQVEKLKQSSTTPPEVMNRLTLHINQQLQQLQQKQIQQAVLANVMQTVMGNMQQHGNPLGIQGGLPPGAAQQPGMAPAGAVAPGSAAQGAGPAGGLPNQ